MLIFYPAPLCIQVQVFFFPKLPSFQASRPRTKEAADERQLELEGLRFSRLVVRLFNCSIQTCAAGCRVRNKSRPSTVAATPVVAKLIERIGMARLVAGSTTIDNVARLVSRLPNVAIDGRNYCFDASPISEDSISFIAICTAR